MKKLADADVDSFGEYDIRQTHILMRQVKTFLSPQEELLWN